MVVYVQVSNATSSRCCADRNTYVRIRKRYSNSLASAALIVEKYSAKYGRTVSDNVVRRRYEGSVLAAHHQPVGRHASVAIRCQPWVEIGPASSTGDVSEHPVSSTIARENTASSITSVSTDRTDSVHRGAGHCSPTQLRTRAASDPVHTRCGSCVRP